MALKNKQPAQLHDAVVLAGQVVNSDGTSKVTIGTIAAGQENETHIYSLLFESDDTAGHNIYLYINNGTRDMYIGYVTVGAIAGGIPGTVNLLQAPATVISRIYLDNKGNYFLKLGPGEILKVAAAVAMQPTKTLYVSADGWSFKA